MLLKDDINNIFLEVSDGLQDFQRLLVSCAYQHFRGNPSDFGKFAFGGMSSEELGNNKDLDAICAKFTAQVPDSWSSSSIYEEWMKIVVYILSQSVLIIN